MLADSGDEVARISDVIGVTLVKACNLIATHPTYLDTPSGEVRLRTPVTGHEGGVAAGGMPADTPLLTIVSITAPAENYRQLIDGIRSGTFRVTQV